MWNSRKEQLTQFLNRPPLYTIFSLLSNFALYRISRPFFASVNGISQDLKQEMNEGERKI
jgi:hypothetical protein